MRVEIKIGRKLFAISERDILMDNGSCVQLITKMNFRGIHGTYPVLSKKLFRDLKICGFIYTNKDLELTAKKYGTHVDLYKFDIPEMIKAGYKEVQ